MNLVPGRECGTCTVCCKEFSIDEPSLRKPPGIRCQHCVPGGGCGIYERRPFSCQEFFCGWRRSEGLDDAWRPDRSGIAIVYLDQDIPAAYQARGNGIKFDILKPKALKWEPLLAVIGQAIEGGVATYLGIPGPPGYLGMKYLLNEYMAASVRSHDRGRLIADLTHVYETGAKAPKKRAFSA